MFFKGGVGNARRADRLNRHFVGRGPPNDLHFLTYPQHRPKIANISPTYAGMVVVVVVVDDPAAALDADEAPR